MKNKSETIDIRYNKQNEVVKYKFFQRLKYKRENNKDPKKKSTIQQYANAIHEFEVATKFKDLKNFTYQWAIDYKEYLLQKKNKKTNKNIAIDSYIHFLQYPRELLDYLRKNEKGYSHIKESDIDYLYPTNGEKNSVSATSYQESYTIQECLFVVRRMQANTEIEMRDKAMISLCLLTAPRISALITAKLRSIRYFREYDCWAFEQNPKHGVKTKNSKYILSFFVGQTQDIIDNIINWKNYLIGKGFNENDPFFPQINQSFDSQGNPINILSKELLNSDSWVRESIFKKTFLANKLPYYSPHRFRKTLARAMKKESNSTMLSIALAQNIGHKNEMALIFQRYGDDYSKEQANLMKSFKLE